MTDIEFLSDQMARPWSQPSRHGLRPVALFVGKGANTMEVAVAQSSRIPNRNALLEGWKSRRAGRAAPVLIVVLHPDGAALCGASGESPPVYLKVDRSQAERLSREVLDQPDRHAALRFLAQALPSLETAVPGLNNEGLVALHELQHGARGRTDWSDARRKAAVAIGRRDQELLELLGFRLESLDSLTWLLRSADRRTALAVMLREEESPEAGATRFNNLSPISYALAKADSENLSFVVMVQGNRLRLYSAALDAGVGRRGRIETYVECQSSLLSDNDLPFLWLLFSAEALAPQGSFSQILVDSHRFAGDLAARLRERIYDDVVPVLAQGIAAARNIERPTQQDLAHTYEMALTVLFRLLFIAYAEDRDLLPYRFNDAYRRRSLKQKAQELAECVISGVEIAEGSSHWQEILLLWQAVADGNREWGVPAYNGGLFSDSPEVSFVGAQLSAITLPNDSFEAALRALLVIETAEDVPGPVDFRSLGVREFGTIYEGLLESELAIAETDLALNRSGAYLPAKKRDVIAVPSGEIYLHNRSGVRKASGSYYTKPFAVNHLLDGALEPALADHLARLDEMDDTDAAQAFFDFRVADIAMGSAHFLIAAIDRIEKAMADYLARRSLTGVRHELAGLRNVATASLGELAETSIIEDGQLLRRLIARRCIYGVDASALSVQLARLAVWIHTFVPGLPLSLLDRTLVLGNSLVGVGSVEEIRDKFAEASGTLFEVDADELLGVAAESLNRLARVNDATLQDIAIARDAMREVRNSVQEVEDLCDLIAARPISEDERVVGFAFEDWDRLADTSTRNVAIAAARQDLENLHPLHFPVAFPEVFLRERPGFDVMLGNPPWKSPITHEVAFWARHFPGLRGLSQEAAIQERQRLSSERPDLTAIMEDEISQNHRMRRALVGGSYPGMGTGDPDVYKAFCWRFWDLTAAKGGRIGVVLPRSALAAKGSTAFRQTMFGASTSIDVTMLVNNRRWVFEEVHPQWTIGLLCMSHGDPVDKSIRLRGPFATYDNYKNAQANPPAAFDNAEVLAWNDHSALPLLPSDHSVEIFAQLRKSPRLDLDRNGCWRARPYGEAHSKTCKKYMLPPGTTDQAAWPVFKGESFDLDVTDTGEYYGSAIPEKMTDWLEDARRRQVAGSAFAEFSKQWALDPRSAPWLSCRVAFRDVARATDSRTLVTAVVPPKVFLTDKAPYFLFARGDIQDQVYLYGILRSIPFDWYARRYVETGVKFYIINCFPIPRPERGHPRWRRVVKLAGRLACPDERFVDWRKPWA